MGVRGGDDSVVSTTELSAILDVNRQSIHRFAQEGKIVPAPGKGKYFLRQSVSTYVRHLRQVAANQGDGSTIDLSSERAREAKARADKLEIHNAQQRGALVPVVTVESQWIAVSTATRRRLMGIPSRMLNSGLSEYDAERLKLELREALDDLADNGLEAGGGNGA